MEEGLPVRNMWTQLQKGRHTIGYSKPTGAGLNKRDLVLAQIYCFGERQMPYTKNFVKSEQELDEEVSHFYFLNKYNLL